MIPTSPGGRRARSCRCASKVGDDGARFDAARLALIRRYQALTLHAPPQESTPGPPGGDPPSSEDPVIIDIGGGPEPVDDVPTGCAAASGPALALAGLAGGSPAGAVATAETARMRSLLCACATTPEGPWAQRGRLRADVRSRDGSERDAVD